jgi:hypothetical protein
MQCFNAPMYVLYEEESGMKTRERLREPSFNKSFAFEEENFCRSVRTTLAQQLLPDMDNETLRDLFTVCDSDLQLLRDGSVARTRKFQRMNQEHDRLLSRLQSLANRLRDSVNAAGSDILPDTEKKAMQKPITHLSKLLDSLALRSRTTQAMANIARRQPNPGTLTQSLNEFLRIHHDTRWNQQQRDMIIAASLQACRAYPAKDTFAQIVSRVPMQRSRSETTTAADGGLVVHRPRAAKQRIGAVPKNLGTS